MRPSYVCYHCATSEPASATELRGAQARANHDAWAGRDLLSEYSGRTLRPPEIVLLIRHRDALSGCVLELGCGCGRLGGYLIEIAEQFHEIDLSATMVAYCRQTYPNGVFEQGDLRDLSRFAPGSFQAVCAPFNVLSTCSTTPSGAACWATSTACSARMAC